MTTYYITFKIRSTLCLRFILHTIKKKGTHFVMKVVFAKPVLQKLPCYSGFLSIALSSPL